MVNEEILEEYSTAVRRLKKQCEDAGMNDEEFKKLYFVTLKSLEKTQNIANSSSNKFKKPATIISLCVLLVIAALNYKILYSCIACKLQDFIYPGLRWLRKLTIPIISLFPSLTALYHETCLIQNPFFTVVDMDCWPCSNVNDIREIYDPRPVSDQHNVPFTYQTDQSIIKMENLKSFYLSNKDSFDREASNILTSTKTYIHPSEMFQECEAGDKNFYTWKFNNMYTAKLLRQLIPRPKVVPKFGQSTERFVIVDTSQGAFKIPDTECSFSFLLALSGGRTVVLKPAEECQHQCKSLKVDLQETYLLWYNWWYWRPVIQPSNGNTTFIAHVGSYC